MSSENIIFTAVPMDNSPFEHLISGRSGSGGGGGGNSTSSDKRKELLRLGLQIAIVVLGLTVFGLILGFSIAAIKHHHHHRHHHHHHNSGLHEALLVESLPESTGEIQKSHTDPSFWSNSPHRFHHDGSSDKKRPKRRHSPHAIMGRTTQTGFWKNSNNNANDNNPKKLRHHDRPESLYTSKEEEFNYDDFFPTDDDSVEEMEIVSTLKAMGGGAN